MSLPSTRFTVGCERLSVAGWRGTWWWVGGIPPSHMPPCHPDIILTRQFSPSGPGYTDLGWLTALLNGARMYSGM